MTYNSVHVSNTVAITDRPGIQVIDKDSHSQAKTRVGHSRWFVMTDSQDLGGIWKYDGRYFSKFSDNEGHVFLDDAVDEIIIATSGYTDYAVEEIDDRLVEETLRQSGCVVNALDPDGEDAAYELLKDGVFVAYIWLENNHYYLNGWMFDGHFITPELAAIEWLGVALPAELDRAQSIAQLVVMSRQSLPDYF